MKSRTKIDKQMKPKRNPSLVETILAAKKNEGWLEVAGLLSAPRRKKININLDKLELESPESGILVVPGKVLSNGEVSKKIKVVAISFSERAKKKLLDSKSEVSTIMEEIKKNPSGKGIKILR